MQILMRTLLLSAKTFEMHVDFLTDLVDWAFRGGSKSSMNSALNGMLIRVVEVAGATDFYDFIICIQQYF